MRQKIKTPIPRRRGGDMTRPPLTLALTSVLAAAIDNAGRPELLATLHPAFGRPVVRSVPAPVSGDGTDLGKLIMMPRVIPMPRRGSAPRPRPEHPGHPEPAA
jgi:hypothetical protein